MDSLTQFVLGSAIATATLGRRTAAWKAVLWGGVAGTLPDLDAFIDHGDAILNMVRHRSESHSLFFLSLLSAPLAWLVARLCREPQHVARWWLALWLALITHPLLDWMTVYGTQLLLPFTNHPYAVGSIFIIDPLYTLPLLTGVLAALALRQGRGLAWVRGALVVSSAYLAWSVAAQQIATQRILASAPVPGLAHAQLLVTPAPFNTLLWRAVAVTPTHYYEGYYSLLDGTHPVAWTSHLRGADLRAQHADNPHVQRLAWFSHGFMRMQAGSQGRLTITDLRMGLEPCYSFHFDIGPAQPLAGETHQVLQQWQRPDLSVALPWWWRRLTDPTAGALSAQPGGDGC